jgi:threonine synthase
MGCGKMPWPGVIRAYREFLPIQKDECIVTLLEGNTPLIPSRAIREVIPKKIHLYYKAEGFNPTASFKDRGMTVAVSKALEEGAKAIICASTGNTSASASAYAARAGLTAYVLVPKGKIAYGKLSQTIAHGAKIVQIDGNFDDALEIVKEVAQKYPITIVNSINPYRLEGQKTASFEICDVLGDAPTYHFLPVGNAGNIFAYWKGYKEYYEANKCKRLPRMMGYQAEGSAPIVRGHPIKHPKTIASAIRIGNPANWEKALKAKEESNGVIDMVSDEEILFAYNFIGSKEGIFCEPASAASLAGVFKYEREKGFEDGDVLVCTLTGHGLKDPEVPLKLMGEPITTPPEFSKVVKALGFK